MSTLSKTSQEPESRQPLADLYINQPNNIFGAIAEIIACVGPELAKEMVIV